MRSIIFVMLSLFLCTELYSQEYQYIRDVLYVPLRSGQSYQHRIVHKGLVSGTKLTLLEVDKEKGYSKIRTEKGIEGWIQTQYLSQTPAARDLYKKEQQHNSELKQQNTSLTEQLTKLKSQHQQSKKEVDTLTSLSKTMSNELNYIKSVSANAISLDSENKKLLEENQELKNKVDILSTNNKQLQESNENDAYLNGALAVLLGVMIALLVPRLWPKKSSEWA